MNTKFASLVSSRLAHPNAVVLALVLLLGLSRPGLAADSATTSKIARGVDYTHYHYDNIYGGPQEIHVTKVDLNQPGVYTKFPYLTAHRTTSAHAATVPGAAAAVNGQLYSLATGEANTYLKVNGSAVYNLPNAGDQGIRDDGLRLTTSISIIPRPGSGSWADAPDANILTAYPKLINNGVKQASFPAGGIYDPKRPRTCVGYTSDNQLYLVVVDGDAPGVRTGMNMYELRDYMFGLASFTYAFGLDGGGSSTMWHSGSGVANVPSDGAQRSVVDAVVIVAPPVNPSSLTATPVGISQINLGWVDNASNETGFKIERSTPGTSSYAQIATVGPHERTFSDTGLSMGTRYYYRLRAYNVAGDSVYSSAASGITYIIKDNTDTSGVTKTGTWTNSTSGPGYHGINYCHDGNTLKGSKSVRYTPTIPVATTYKVYARWTAGTNRATNVPIDVIHAGGTTTVVVNQQLNGSTWYLLGTYTFNAGTGGSVLIRTTGTNGYVIADAVRWVD